MKTETGEKDKEHKYSDKCLCKFCESQREDWAQDAVECHCGEENEQGE